MQAFALRLLLFLGRELSGCADGSSTSWANSTARHAASGRRAHHRCSVDGCPCRIDFSRADSRLMSSSGSATSISFGLYQRSLRSYRVPSSFPLF